MPNALLVLWWRTHEAKFNVQTQNVRTCCRGWPLIGRVNVERLSTVRMAWRVAGKPPEEQPPSTWGRKASRQPTIPAHHIESFVEGCRRISVESEAKDLLPSRLVRTTIHLPTSEDLRQRMQVLASQASAGTARISSAPQRTGLLARVASWAGLLPERAAGPREGLLEGLIRTGVPMREELLETVDKFHVQLNSLRLEQDVSGRARQGAVLLTQLQFLGELLLAAQRLLQSGHGQTAGLDLTLLEELVQQIEATQIAVAQVVALPVEHASFVTGVQRNWQQALWPAGSSHV